MVFSNVLVVSIDEFEINKNNFVRCLKIYMLKDWRIFILWL